MLSPFWAVGPCFFFIASRYPLSRVVLADANQTLMLSYTIVKLAVSDLIGKLRRLQDRYIAASAADRKSMYYDVRAAFNSESAPGDFSVSEKSVERAAHMIFLNKTCFNGLTRHNANGRFNVPFGSYAKPAICDPAVLHTASALLQKAELVAMDYGKTPVPVNPSTFIYYDPPYRPLSASSRFTAYTGGEFSDAEQKRLAALFATRDAEGALQMLSNSDPTNTRPGDDFFDTLYGSFHISRVSAGRVINADGGRRGRIAELVVTNYRPPSDSQPV